VARRKLSRQPAPWVPDVFGDYLFDVPPVLPLPPPAARSDVTVATIGGQLLFGPAEVGQARGGRKLFAQTVFGPKRVADLVQGMVSPFADPRWGDHAVAHVVRADTSLPLDAAARMAITDFYYFPTYRHGADHYIGGVVDLFPIELAHRLADTVMLEFKESFDQHFEIPAWRAVLGLDGNQRLRHVNSQSADVWFDTSDVASALPVQPVQRRLEWWRNRIVLAQPTDYAAYVQAMESQWQYGYQRGQEALQRPVPGGPPGMRNMDRYNWVGA
jgi:hypothetical protein